MSSGADARQQFAEECLADAASRGVTADWRGEPVFPGDECCDEWQARIIEEAKLRWPHSGSGPRGERSEKLPWVLAAESAQQRILDHASTLPRPPIPARELAYRRERAAAAADEEYQTMRHSGEPVRQGPPDPNWRPSEEAERFAARRALIVYEWRIKGLPE